MKKLDEISIFKAMAAIMVIIIHVTATPAVTLTGGIYYDVVLFLNRFAKPSVPMFIFASGLTLYYSYRNKTFEYGSFIKKRLKTIVVPYLIWCCIYYAYFVITGTYTFSASFLLKNILTGKMIYHLYFIVIIVQFYFLFGIVRYTVSRFNTHIVLGISFALNFLYIKFVHFEYSDRAFPTYLAFFMLGCLFAANLERAKTMVCRYKLLITVIFMLSGTYFSYQFYQTQTLGVSIDGFILTATFIVFSLAGILLWYYISLLIDYKTGPEGADSENSRKSALRIFIRRGIFKISEASFYIYLSHPLALCIAGAIMNRMGIEGVLDRMAGGTAFIAASVFPLSFLYADLRKNRMEKSRNMMYNN